MNELDKKYKISLIIYISNIFILILIILGFWVLKNKNNTYKSALDNFETNNLSFLRYLFYILSLSIFYVRNFLKNKYLNQKFLNENELIEKLRIYTIISGALSEAIAILSFILFLLSGNKLDFYILISLSIISFIINIPNKNKWIKFIEENKKIN